MEEMETKNEQEIVGQNEENLGKTPMNSEKKPHNETKSNIIIGIVAATLILSVAATFIGASINEKQNTNEPPTPTFQWDTDRSGFYDKNGQFLGAAKSHRFTDRLDDANRKYVQVTSIEPLEDAYAYVFPSYLNNMTEEKVETVPIYAVGNEKPKDTEPIKKSVFGDSLKNKGITEIYFQSLYKEICDYSFYNCVDLEKVEFRSFASGKQMIGESAFAKCHKLKDVVLSENLNLIAPRAFEDDDSLETITLPKSLTNIGDYVFKGTSLKEINYSGTKSGWEKIAKTNDWSEGLSGCKINFLEEGTTEEI